MDQVVTVEFSVAKTLESDIQLERLCCHNMKTVHKQPKSKKLNLPGLWMAPNARLILQNM